MVLEVNHMKMKKTKRVKWNSIPLVAYISILLLHPDDFGKIIQSSGDADDNVAFI